MNVEREGQRHEFCTTIFLPHIMSVQITVMMYQIHILTHTPTPVESVNDYNSYSYLHSFFFLIFYILSIPPVMLLFLISSVSITVAFLLPLFYFFHVFNTRLLHFFENISL